MRERSVPRVVMVIARFYPTVGGTERQAFNLSKALVAKDVPVQVIAGKSKGLWPSHEHVADIPVWRYPAWRSYVFGLATALWRLRHTYDLIHVHQMLYPAWVAGVMGRWLGKPVIAKASNSGERFDLHLLKASLPVAGRLMAEAMPRLLTRVIAIATPIVEDLQAAGFSSQQIVPIPNGVALAAALSDESRRQARQQLGLPADVPLLIFTGTYTPKKNLSLLLRAMARVRARGHLCELLLVGDGPERRQLEALADGSGLRSAVHFTGLVTDVTPYLRAADVFVLPSRVEGLSNALLEAMAHDLPVVATDVGGNRDVIEDGRSGFLVPPGDEERFAARLETMLADATLQRQMGAAGRRRIETDFDLDGIAEQVIQLYLTLVS